MWRIAHVLILLLAQLLALTTNNLLLVATHTLPVLAVASGSIVDFPAMGEWNVGLHVSQTFTRAAATGTTLYWLPLASIQISL